MNPISPPICTGPGIGIDSLGRPQWAVEIAGVWETPGEYRAGHSGTATVNLQAILASLYNGSTNSRAVLVEFNCGWVNISSYPGGSPGANAGPKVEYFNAVGPPVTVGYVKMGENRLDGFDGMYGLVCANGPSRTELYEMPPLTTYKFALNTTMTAIHATSLYDINIGPIRVTAYWLGS